MTMFFVSSTWFEPSSPTTSTCPAAAMRAVPWNMSTLFFFSRNSTPLTLPSTPSSLKAIIFGRSSFGSPTLMPRSAKWCPASSNSCGGVQQRLGGDAADIEAGAAVRLALLHDGGLQAELRGADGAHIAAGAGADDDEIVGHELPPLLARAALELARGLIRVRCDRKGLSPSHGNRPGHAAAHDGNKKSEDETQRSSTSRAGSSSASLTRTRKVTASLPSTIRWS